jgi:hypothetical protein
MGFHYLSKAAAMILHVHLQMALRMHFQLHVMPTLLLLHSVSQILTKMKAEIERLLYYQAIKKLSCLYWLG